MCFANIFPQAVACLLLLMLCLTEPRCFTLMKSGWLIISFMDHTIGAISEKPLPLPRSSWFSPVLFSRSLIVGVVQSLSHAWLCNPMDCSTPGLPVLHCLPELAQTHVHQVGDAIQSSHPLLPLGLLPQCFPASGSFPVSWLFTSGGQSIGASVSVSAFLMNIQS